MNNQKYFCCCVGFLSLKCISIGTFYCIVPDILEVRLTLNEVIKPPCGTVFSESSRKLFNYVHPLSSVVASTTQSVL